LSSREGRVRISYEFLIESTFLHKLYDLHYRLKYRFPIETYLEHSFGKKKQMENEERAKLEVQHQKEVDNLREESGKATHIAQPEPMPVNPVNPQNMGANGLSFDIQQAMHF